MSILVGKDTRVVVQGITGSAGSFHSTQCIAYGTQIVSGCTPNRGGEKFEAKGPSGESVQVPVFDTVDQAVRETAANTACIFVPALGAADAILEAADAGCDLVICITEGIPVMDMLRVRRALDGRSVRLIGPNCPGIITPGSYKLGIMPGHIHLPGKLGVVSRSGTLTYEAVGQLTALGLGQSTCVGIGGDPVGGMDFIDVLRLFNEDPGHRWRYDDWRNRWQCGGGCRGVHQGQHEEACSRVHRGCHGATRQAHGPCGRDHFWR